MLEIKQKIQYGGHCVYCFLDKLGIWSEEEVEEEEKKQSKT